MRAGLPYELMIGRRYLRSTGNRFLSFISLISMLGVAIGVAVLIVVLSVMNGFERELRSRILSVTSHATVSSFGAGLADWRAARRRALAESGGRGVAPFVEGEALLIGDRAGAGSAAAQRARRAARARGTGLRGRRSAHLWHDGGTASRGLSRHPRRGARQGAQGARGDTVVLAIAQGSVTPAGVVPRLRRFQVEGVFASGMYEIDRTLALRASRGRGAALPPRRPRHGAAARDGGSMARACGRARGRASRSVMARMSTTGRIATRTSSARSSSPSA